MITHVSIKNFKCFKDFEIDLDPLTVLIGPNDSGKTTFLQAIELAATCGQGITDIGALSNAMALPVAAPFSPNGDMELVPQIELSGIGWKGSERAEEELSLPICYGPPPANNFRPFAHHSPERALNASALTEMLMGRTSYFSFVPGVLRSDSAIEKTNVEATPAERVMSRDGAGFPTYLEDFLREDRYAFREMEDRFYTRFPSYKIYVKKHGKNNTLRFGLKGNGEIPASHVSDGAILYLAYLSLCYHPNHPHVLLLEEPENGVHHASLRDIIGMLKEVASEGQVQIIVTTHSPYLLDEVEPENVRVFAKLEDGSVKAKKLSDHPDVERMKKHFMTGEIWTEFDEKELVEGKAGE